MINLPRFTFLCGKFGLGQTALVRELCSSDDNLLRLDLTYMIHDTMANMFPDSMPVTRDPLESQDGLVMPDEPAVRIGHFMAELIQAFRVTFGTNALGMFAQRKFVREDLGRLFERFIFPDCIDPEDAEVFITEYGPQDCLALFLGRPSDIRSIGFNRLKCKQIWLPEPSASKKTETLRKELNVKPSIVNS